MYIPHQNARLIPINAEFPTMKVRSERSETPRTLPMISATASEKDGVVTVSLANVDLTKSYKLVISLGDIKAKSVTGEILTAPKIAAYNDFDHPNDVKTQAFNNAKIKNGELTLTIPAKSIITLSLK
jgi:alpha-N-arabinofuranosidase